MRLAIAFLALLALGCHYEPSICESSPGSGCAECTTLCDQDHAAGTVALAECHARCHEGRWAAGFR